MASGDIGKDNYAMRKFASAILASLPEAGRVSPFRMMVAQSFEKNMGLDVTSSNAGSLSIITRYTRLRGLKMVQQMYKVMHVSLCSLWSSINPCIPFDY